jgi:hypothetical protein
MRAETEDTGLQPGIDWVCVDAADPAALARWWQGLIGGDLSADPDGDMKLEAPGARLYFLLVRDRKVVKNRLHFDLRASDFDVAVARALRLGAVPAPDVYDGDRWQVLRDPEGNEFCILRPTYAPYRAER